MVMIGGRRPVLGRGEDPRKISVTCWCLCCALGDDTGPRCWVMPWYLGITADFILLLAKSLN